MADLVHADPDVTLDTPVTPAEPIEPSPTPEGGNEGSPSEPQKNEDDVTSLKEKYSQSSTEAKRLKGEVDSANQKFDKQEQMLLKQVTKTRDTFESYINDLSISSSEREHYMNVYDTEYAPKNGEDDDKGDSPKLAPVAPRVDPFERKVIDKVVAQEREKFELQQTASQEFFDKSENRNLPDSVHSSIIATAAMLDEQHGYSPSEALDIARKRILEPEALKDAGYADGIRDSYQSGINRGLSGGRGGIEDVVKLPAKDENFVSYEISKRKLTGDKAQEFREQYAARLAKRN